MRAAAGLAIAVAGALLAGCGASQDTGAPIRRVDTARPSFSEPTVIDNPLFPVSPGGQTLQLGTEEGEPLRVEVTTLPRTRTITWDGRRIDAVVSQYVAYRSGRVVEVALDYYAQDDDGGVWYLGEDVDNYERGVVADHEGSWLAGRDGPGGLIMPAQPRPGDVFRPENIPDLVFEEVTIQDAAVTVDGPRGLVDGAVATEEHLMDGTVEHKVFAPGYGEFRAETSDELVQVAVAVPADAAAGAVPAVLTQLAGGAARVYDDAGAGLAVGASVDAMTSAWRDRPDDTAPPALAAALDDALGRLSGAGDPTAVRQAAVDTATAVLDLTLPYRPPAEVDGARLDLVARQLAIDTETGDVAGQRSDAVAIAALRDRGAATR
ncbi:hypothetical protein [Jiangella sp. DSM 45060]|uniref:hypothetical protein n=1 Tax=Jiangella sp. DSM 45060 TaxID=1798224 RepID=UPI00087CD13A|nr:hypothetical protein [Jiangella sp. DSM 45060]SDT38990.1 hypothetical protein SAMN04515669_3840 [Jiangella sp. DSM 45060]